MLLTMKKIIELIRKMSRTKYTGDDLEEMIEMVNDYLETDPDNLEMLLRQATLVLKIPVVDFYESIDLLERFLEINPTDSTALLMLAYVHWMNIGRIPEEVYAMLCKALPNNFDHQGMLSFAKAWFFYDGDQNLYVQMLKQSIAECPHHVWNHVYLARHFLEKENKQEAFPLVQKAINNIAYIFPYNPASESNPCDISDCNEIFDEEIKGIYLTSTNKELLEELLEKCR